MFQRSIATFMPTIILLHTAAPPPKPPFMRSVYFIVFFACIDDKESLIKHPAAAFSHTPPKRPGLADPRTERSALSTLGGCARPCLAWKGQSTRGCAKRSCRRWCFPGARASRRVHVGVRASPVRFCSVIVYHYFQQARQQASPVLSPFPALLPCVGLGLAFTVFVLLTLS